MSTNDHYPQSEEQPDEECVSKTKRKKEMDELQAIGEELLQLSNAQLEKFPLSDKLQAALAEGKRLKKREALRRHKQFLGRVMREEDEDRVNSIRQQLDEMKNAHQTHTRAFKELENIREDLVSGGNEEIGQLIAQFPDLDSQKLRQLVKQAKKEQLNNAPPAASRKLFRFLRQLHETDSSPGNE